jgi:hypothetical protein
MQDKIPHCNCIMDEAKTSRSNFIHYEKPYYIFLHSTKPFLQYQSNQFQLSLNIFNSNKFCNY